MNEDLQLHSQHVPGHSRPLKEQLKRSTRDYPEFRSWNLSPHPLGEASLTLRVPNKPQRPLQQARSPERKRRSASQMQRTLLPVACPPQLRCCHRLDAVCHTELRNSGLAAAPSNFAVVLKGSYFPARRQRSSREQSGYSGLVRWPECARGFDCLGFAAGAGNRSRSAHGMLLLPWAIPGSCAD